MLDIKLIKIPDEWLIPDEDGDVTKLKTDTVYRASDKGAHFRIYEPEDINIPKEIAVVLEN